MAGSGEEAPRTLPFAAGARFFAAEVPMRRYELINGHEIVSDRGLGLKVAAAQGRAIHHVN
jgi:hypothetical protein